MERAKIIQQKELIAKEADQTLAYVKGFEVFSARDEQALAEILAMFHAISSAVIRIETAHQRRIQLMNELEKTLRDMEGERRKFAEKVGKLSAEGAQVTGA